MAYLRQNRHVCLRRPIRNREESKISGSITLNCWFRESADKYIPKNLVIKSDKRSKKRVESRLKSTFIIHPDSYHDEDFIYGAVENGHLPIVTDLLKYGINVNMVNSKTGLNLLTIACLNKHHGIVEKLLQHNANINVKISSENETLNNNTSFERNMREFSNFFKPFKPRNVWINVTCLHIAIFNSDLKTIDILLRYSAKIEDNTELFTLICYAVRNSWDEIVHIFLKHGVDVADIHSHENRLLCLCLGYCSYQQESTYNILRMLLEKGVDIHLETPRNMHVFKAIEDENHEIAQLFLDYNADVQYISPNGQTLLHKAIKNCPDAKLIRTLLQRNLPVNTVDNEGQTPLLDACLHPSYDQLEIIEVLLCYGADVNCTDHHLKTPLHWVSSVENLQVVQLLLNKGANLHAMDRKGQTPLHYACKYENDEIASIMQLLLEHGANIEAVDDRGMTPLFTACEEDNYVAVEFLLNHHANPNHTNLENSSPLHCAVNWACVKPDFFDETHNIVDLLIKHGARTDRLNGKNQTPLNIAVEKIMLYVHDNSNDFSVLCDNCVTVLQAIKLQEIKLKTARLEVNNYKSKIKWDSIDCFIIDMEFDEDEIRQLNEDSYTDGEITMKSVFHLSKDFVSDAQQLQVKCEQEIEKMKKECIGIDNLTLYDLLKKNIRFLGRLVKNNNIQQIIEMKGYDKKFPLYVDMVKNRLRDAKIHYEHYMLSLSAREYFTLHVNARLPHECIDEIFSYLSIREVEAFIEAMKL